MALWHLNGRTELAWLTSYGYLGVAIFFVLSGFVISKVIGSEPVDWSYSWRFAARRAVRLDPPYWVSIAVALMLMAAAVAFGESREFPGLGAVLAHLVYLQALLGYKQIGDNYWTLCLEVQFYLFLLLMLAIGRQRVESRVFQAVVVVLYVLSLAEYASLVSFSPRGFFFPWWNEFLLGAMVLWSIEKRMSPKLLFAAIALALLATPLEHGEWSLTAALTASSIYLAARVGAMQRWLSGSLAQFFGRISYSLYLFHPFIGWTAQSVAWRVVDQWTALGIGMAASISSAWIAYVVLERPSIRLSRMIVLRPVKRSCAVTATD